VLWAVDTFALPLQRPTETADDIPDADFTEGGLLGARLVAPWHQLVDEQKFHAHVDQVQSLPIEMIASCHAPVIRGGRMARAFELVRSVPTIEPWDAYTQQDLEHWLEQMAGAPAG
jgi:hypothetical protein